MKSAVRFLSYTIVLIGTLTFSIARAHTLGNIVPQSAQGKDLILNLTFEEFKKYTQVSNPFADFLSLEDTSVVNLQSWVNNLHQSLVDRYPDQMAGIPVPQIAVLRDDNVNAYASSFVTTFEVNVQINDPNALASKTTLLLNFASADNLIGVPDIITPLLQIQKNTVFLGRDHQMLRDFLEVYRLEALEHSPLREKCTATYQNDTVVFAGECLGTQRSFTSSSLLSVSFFSNWFVVNSGLLAAASSDEVLAVVSHELAHYYRNQIVLPPSTTGFVYRLADHYSGSAPPPIQNPEQIHQAFLNISLSKLVPEYGNVTGSPYNRVLEVYFFSSKLRHVLNENCSTSECNEAWSRLNQYLQESEYGIADQLMDFRYKDCGFDCLRPIDRELYVDAINLLVTAAQLTHVSNSTQVTLDEIIVNLPYEVELIYGEEIRMRPSWTLADLLADYSQKYEQVSALLTQIQAQAAEEGLGYYTYEQEADELSLEFLHLTGVDPRVAVQLFFNTNPNFDDETRAVCHDNWESGWLSPVPQGAWFSEHHDVCFRIYNIDREIEAHHYSVQ